MAVAVRCQHCGQRYSVREDLLGKRMQCKACGQPTPIVATPPDAKPEPTRSATRSASPQPVGAKPAATKPAATKPRAAIPNAQPKQPVSGTAPTASAAKPVGGGAGRQATGAAAPAARPRAAPIAAASAPPAAADPLGASAAPDDPLFGPSAGLFDLLGDAALPAAGATPLSSGVMLKASAPAPAAKPKGKKKKKKRSGDGSPQAQALLRMMGGAAVILLGLAAFGMAIYKATEEEPSPYRAIRWTIFGISLIGSGVKLIVG